MAQPYVGEIRMFAGNFAPVGWAFCSGQLLPISENDTLFSLIGTTYGGDGQATFAVPDLRGRVPVHVAPAQYQLGEKGGAESVTLVAAQVPPHGHSLLASSQAASAGTTNGNVAATLTDGTSKLYAFADGSPTANLAPAAVSSVGTGAPHENRMPYLPVSFIISLFGIYPSQA